MKYGLQTHFNALIDVDILHQVRAFGFNVARMDCQTVNRDLLLDMITDCLICDMQPLPIVNFGQLVHLPPKIHAEFRNEPDGDIDPQEYRKILEEACQIAKDGGINLWAPAISNLDEDSLKWLNDVKGQAGWPEGLHGISVHRYGDGTFEKPHDGFSSREREVFWLKAACVGLPYIVTEYGYPTMDGLTDADQADRVTKEWQFWLDQDAEIATLFQISDGPFEVREHRYGIRRVDGTWKPAAFTIPNIQEGQVPQATFVLHRRDLIPHPGKPAGYFTCRFPSGADTVISVQPDGSVQTRPAGTTGPWETLKDEGTRAVFEETENGVWAFPLVGE